MRFCPELANFCPEAGANLNARGVSPRSNQGVEHAPPAAFHYHPFNPATTCDRLAEDFDNSAEDKRDSVLHILKGANSGMRYAEDGAGRTVYRRTYERRKCVVWCERNDHRMLKWKERVKVCTKDNLAGSGPTLVSAILHVEDMRVSAAKDMLQVNTEPLFSKEDSTSTRMASCVSGKTAATMISGGDILTPPLHVVDSKVHLRAVNWTNYWRSICVCSGCSWGSFRWTFPACAEWHLRQLQVL